MKRSYAAADKPVQWEVYADHRVLCLTVTEASDCAEVDFFFEYGPDRMADAPQLEEMAEQLADGLAKLLALAGAENIVGETVPDGVQGGVEGNISTLLEAKDGMLVYMAELTSVGCMGEARVQFGPATKERTKAVSRAVKRFDGCLMDVVYRVKHHYIDHMTD